MMKSLQIPKMDMSNKTPILVFLIISINYVSGLVVPQPVNLTVNISDGEVIVQWSRPAGALSNTMYNLEMAKYGNKWAPVPRCTGITATYCDLSSCIIDYTAAYRVRVQLVAGHNTSAWQTYKKRFLLNESKLQPPSFTLLATSSTLTVSVHEKPILNKIFTSGLTYTIYLEERGEDSKNTTAYMKDDKREQRSKTFSSLHWGREYCVSIKVEANAVPTISGVSPKHCVLLPEQEWFIIAVSSLSIMSVLVIIAITAAILLCYLRRTEKTPAALKSPVSGWFPLTVGEGTMEVVTDKGWFLSSYGTDMKNCIAKDPVTLHVTVTEDNGEEDRRTSTDSGVTMEANSATKKGESPPMRQEDSGCGSIGGPESSTSSQTDYPLQDERTDTDTVRKREDSGVGLGCQLDSSSMNLDALDSKPLKEIVAGGNYHSQSRSAVQICVCDDEERTVPDSVLAEVVTGYRAGPQSCICSGAGQCTWCHKQGFNETEKIKQYRALCIENGILSNRCNIIDSYKEELTFSSYPSKAQMDTVMMSDLETTFIHLGDTFPLLTALSPLTLLEGGQDFNMNDVSLSLCDVQLTTD